MHARESGRGVKKQEAGLWLACILIKSEKQSFFTCGCCLRDAVTAASQRKVADSHAHRRNVTKQPPNIMGCTCVWDMQAPERGKNKLAERDRRGILYNICQTSGIDVIKKIKKDIRQMSHKVWCNVSLMLMLMTKKNKTPLYSSSPLSIYYCIYKAIYSFSCHSLYS